VTIDQSFTVELRDSSPAGRAELETLVRSRTGEPSGVGDQLTVRAVNHKTAEAIFHLVENDPRVISNEERVAAAAQERLLEYQAEQEAARHADRVAQLEAQVARSSGAHRRAGVQLTSASRSAL
jgi:hypothetical protein